MAIHAFFVAYVFLLVAVDPPKLDSDKFFVDLVLVGLTSPNIPEIFPKYRIAKELLGNCEGIARELLGNC